MRRPRVHLRLTFGERRTFGPGKADLLALIARLGSISAAGREMKMSYKRAWGLVEEMNLDFKVPLVTTERGGAERGGARLTEFGAQVLGHYRHLVDGVAGPDLDFFATALAAGSGLSDGGDSVMSEET